MKQTSSSFIEIHACGKMVAAGLFQIDDGVGRCLQSGMVLPGQVVPAGGELIVVFKQGAVCLAQVHGGPAVRPQAVHDGLPIVLRIFGGCQIFIQALQVRLSGIQGFQCFPGLLLHGGYDILLGDLVILPQGLFPALDLFLGKPFSLSHGRFSFCHNSPVYYSTNLNCFLTVFEQNMNRKKKKNVVDGGYFP